ncbi:DUF1622 domain-containing protein [Pleurocapsales cyanobacterium LEGE 06147]|nr:DUF1622 domain-containing protein [Pleurocapsales cyanobacterium LEGE 06147]
MLITLVKTLNGWVVSLCQLLALFVIVTGIIKALIIYCKYVFSDSRSALAFQASRLELGYSFSLGLSFLVGGRILRTTIAPTWNDLGKLAVIIAIRTVLNYNCVSPDTIYAKRKLILHLCTQLVQPTVRSLLKTQHSLLRF